MKSSSRLSAVDAMFVGIETNRLHMHVGALLVFENGPLATPEDGVDIEKLSEYLGHAMSSLPNHRRRLAPSSLVRHPFGSTMRIFTHTQAHTKNQH